MGTFTSASAAKYLKGLQDEKDHVLTLEKSYCTYTLAANEEADVDTAAGRLRSFADAQQDLAAKHGLSLDSKGGRR